MDALLPYVEDLRRRMDPVVEEENLAAWRRFADGRLEVGPFRAPRRPPAPPGVRWPRVTVNDALRDEETMLYSQLFFLHRILERGDGTPLSMRPNYGVVNTAVRYGAPLFPMEDDKDCLPNCRALGPEAMRSRVDDPLPPPEAGNGPSIRRFAERFAALRQAYPEFERFVAADPPDLQSPMDNLELLWGSDVFYALYDEPEAVHRWLRKLTDDYFLQIEGWFSVLPPMDGYHTYLGRVCRGGIFLRSDSAMNLSGPFYDEYCRPYDAALLGRYGGGVHFCGRGEHFCKRLASIGGLTHVDVSQPELNDMTLLLETFLGAGINMTVGPGRYLGALRPGDARLRRLCVF